MAFRLLPRKKKSKFQRAADGSMTLIEHLYDLRSRLFKATLAVLVGFGVGYFFSQRVLTFIMNPFCELQAERKGASADELCDVVQNSPIDEFLLSLKVALFIGLLLSAPFWLYQLWAFIAPGLHKHERRYSYYFAAVSAPLFVSGSLLGWFVLQKSLEFITGLNADNYVVTLNLSDTFSFVTQVMLLFGAGFEFPLLLAMLNVFGIVTAKRMLGWWRVVVLLSFLFTAIVTPTPDPFGMTILAGAMSTLYFGAVGFAFLNDKRRALKNPDWTKVGDDEASAIEEPDDVPAPDSPIEDQKGRGRFGRRKRFDDDAT
ncbi:MAG: twin-arginine translocase subunit TatC [Stackebrandtia sp.]